jgi:hypothetical protein
MVYLIKPNVSAMVSAESKGTVLSIKHLAKTFYFVLSFSCKAKSKDLADLVKSTNLWVKHKTRINYSHCYQLAYNLVSYSSNFFHMSINSFIPSFLRSVLTIKSFPILVSVLKNIWVATPGSPPV